MSVVLFISHTTQKLDLDTAFSGFRLFVCACACVSLIVLSVVLFISHTQQQLDLDTGFSDFWLRVSLLVSAIPGDLVKAESGAHLVSAIRLGP